MNTKIKCVIVDDEPLAVQLINNYAQQHSSLDVIYAGSDINQVISILNVEKIDLIFLDIQMPQMTGVELMQLFDEQYNFIITSAYPEYALDAFKFHVIDYLLKPITFSRFYQAVDKFIQWKMVFQSSSFDDYIFVRADRKYHKIVFSEIDYIEGLRDYIRIHVNGEKIMVLENLKTILDKLPSNRFVRIHRSYIISIDKIKLIEGNRIQLNNHEFVPIGDTYKQIVLQFIKT